MMYCFIDVETTGLDPEKNGLIEVSFGLKTELISNSFDKILTLRVNPEGYEVEDRALEVNGFTREEIVTFPKAEEHKEALESFFGSCLGVVPVGHNVKFDLAFIEKQLFKSFWPFHFYSVDTMSLAVLLLSIKKEPFPIRLDSLRKYYGLPTEGAHRSYKDICDTASILNRLVEEFKK